MFADKTRGQNWKNFLLDGESFFVFLEKVGIMLIKASSPAVARMFPFFEKDDEVTLSLCSLKCKTISGSDIIYRDIGGLF